MRLLVLVLAVVCACGSRAPQVPVVVREAALDPLRLPRDFIPSGYTARLAIDPAQPTFTGEIAIAGTLPKPSQVIWLHGKNLAIKRARAIRGDRAVDLTVTAGPDDRLELRATEPLAGAWTVAIDYEGKLVTDSRDGAFHSKYGADDYVLTHFEPIHARRVFPCVDELDRKVPWQLTLDIPAKLVAVSNTPVAKTESLGDRTRVAFEPTRPLSSYLVAFAIGPFDFVDAGKSASGVPLRIVVPRGSAERAAFAAKATPRLVDRLERWFGIPFPYKKLDVIVAPSFDGDAMENAGAIICDPINALVDKDNPSWASRHSVALVIGHEIAHQWFGDLVTPAWWDELWLKEAFATWIESWIGVWFDRDWDDEQLFVAVRTSAMHADSLVTARRIREPITKPDGILNAFDGITYNKGAAVLRMIEQHVGEGAFQRGVRAYLRAHLDGTATMADLVAALERESNRYLGHMLAGFVDRAGVPELTMRLVCEPEPRVELSQQRAVTAGSPRRDPEPPWTVPVCVVYERGGKRVEKCGVLGAAQGSIALDGACPAWVMGNAGGHGYYYTAVTQRDVELLRDRAWPLLVTAERRALLEDARAAALRGKLPLATLMSLVPKLLADDSLAIAEALGGATRFRSLYAMTGMPFLVEPTIPADLQGRAQGWVRDTIGARAAKLGFEPHDEDLERELAAKAIVSAAAYVRDPGLAVRAVELAAKYRELPSAVRGTVLTFAVDASPAIEARVRADVFVEPERERRGELLAALAHVRDPARLAKNLDLALDPKLAVSDIPQLVFAFDDEPSRAGVEQWLRARLPELRKRLPPAGDESFARFLGAAFTAACDPKRRDEIADFVTKNFGTLVGGELVVKQQIERMDQCIAQRALVEPSVRTWLGGS